MTADKLLTRIIKKGSMIGTGAEMWRRDKVKKYLFLEECSQMCESEMFKEFWGAELTGAITNYCRARYFKKSLKEGINRDVIHTIKELRRRKGPKQYTLAEILGMTQSNYSKLERGTVPINLVQLEMISRALDISVVEIIALAVNRKNSSSESSCC